MYPSELSITYSYHHYWSLIINMFVCGRRRRRRRCLLQYNVCALSTVRVFT